MHLDITLNPHLYGIYSAYRDYLLWINIKIGSRETYLPSFVETFHNSSLHTITMTKTFCSLIYPTVSKQFPHQCRRNSLSICKFKRVAFHHLYTNSLAIANIVLKTFIRFPTAKTIVIAEKKKSDSELITKNHPHKFFCRHRSHLLIKSQYGTYIHTNLRYYQSSLIYGGKHVRNKVLIKDRAWMSVE